MPHPPPPWRSNRSRRPARGNVTCSEAPMPSARSWLSVSAARLATSASYAICMSRAISATGPRCSVVSSPASHRYFASSTGPILAQLAFSPATSSTPTSFHEVCFASSDSASHVGAFSRLPLSVAEDSLGDVLALPVLRALKHRTRKDLQHLFVNALASDKHQLLLACTAALLVCLGLAVSLVPPRPL